MSSKNVSYLWKLLALSLACTTAAPVRAGEPMPSEIRVLSEGAVESLASLDVEVQLAGLTILLTLANTPTLDADQTRVLIERTQVISRLMPLRMARDGRVAAKSKALYNLLESKFLIERSPAEYLVKPGADRSWRLPRFSTSGVDWFWFHALPQREYRLTVTECGPVEIEGLAFAEPYGERQTGTRKIDTDTWLQLIPAHEEPKRIRVRISKAASTEERDCVPRLQLVETAALPKLLLGMASTEAPLVELDKKYRVRSAYARAAARLVLQKAGVLTVSTGRADAGSDVRVDIRRGHHVFEAVRRGQDEERITTWALQEGGEYFVSVRDEGKPGFFDMSVGFRDLPVGARMSLSKSCEEAHAVLFDDRFHASSGGGFAAFDLDAGEVVRISTDLNHEVKRADGSAAVLLDKTPPSKEAVVGSAQWLAPEKGRFCVRLMTKFQSSGVDLLKFERRSEKLAIKPLRNELASGDYVVTIPKGQSTSFRVKPSEALRRTLMVQSISRDTSVEVSRANETGEATTREPFYLDWTQKGAAADVVRLTAGEEAAHVFVQFRAKVPYSGLKVGDRVRLERHRVVRGSDNWIEAMAAFVGRETVVTELVGTDRSGEDLVRVKDGGAWVWRSSDLIVLGKEGSR
jgi:hypothetical protein